MFSIFILLLSTGACAVGVGAERERERREGGRVAGYKGYVDTGSLGSVTQLEITAEKQATDPNQTHWTLPTTGR